MGGIRRTEADYYALAAKRGFKCLADAIPNSVRVPVRWRCTHGHEWAARFDDIRQGKGCPYCYGNNRKLDSDYHALAEQYGFEWIGEAVPPNVSTKTVWCCAHGHEWTAIFNSLDQGNGCPHCSGLARKTAADYYTLAAHHGFEWIGEALPPNVSTKTVWRCSKGHEWENTYAHIQNGQGCPYCARVASKTITDYRALALRRGFEWIGETVPPNTKTNTVWRCANNHEWHANYSNINRGRGCPHCQDFVNSNRVSKPQRAVHALIGGILNHPVSRYRIDVAILEPTPIAIEYDCWYWHNGNEAHERKRDAFLQRQGWKILHIRAGELIPTIEQLQAAIQRLIDGEAAAEIILSDWKEGGE